MDVSRKPNPKIPGTKTSLHNSQTIISSGVPSLDHVIGGGIPVGSIFLVEEDEYGKYSNVMFKYYLSEGVVCEHKLLLATLDNDPDKLLLEIPSPVDPENDSSAIKETTQTDDPIKIAWRYKNLNPVESTLGCGTQFGHYFDMNKPINESTLSTIEKKIWKFSPIESGNTNSVYESLLHFIKNEIQNNSIENSKNKSSSVLRIAIQSLGSPFWQINENPKSEKKNETEFVIQFLYCLRALVRSTFAVVFLTIPVHLYQSLDDTLRIRHLVDASIKLDAFAGTDRESNPSLRDYHGLFYMPKLLSINTLAPYIPPTLDLAFKLKRKRFLIEKLHLPPELQESSEREQDDGSLLSCGSIKRQNLEF